MAAGGGGGGSGGDFTPDSIFGSFSGSAMDLDFMDELLFDGCWVETQTAEKLNNSRPGPSASSDLNDSSRQLPSVDFTCNRGTYQQFIGASVTEGMLLGNPKVEELDETFQSQNVIGDNTSPLEQFEGNISAGNEFGQTLWIGPRANYGQSSVRDRLLNAIKHLRECTKDRDVLIQIWVPIKKGGKNVLSTIDQPFFLNPNYKDLESYRNISERFNFRAEADSKELVGLPGRVFLKELPEFTPDVSFFRSDEYPRKNHAKQYNIRGSLAVPVFNRESGTCLGVVEIVTTTQNVDCNTDLENVCKALEAVDLTGSQDFCPPNVKACKEFCQDAVPELSDILGSVCKMHGLPLALTWAPCFRQGKGGCRHFDERYAHCISTVDSACFVANEELLRFHAACSKQFLFLGQGIVGRAFMKNKQCFASNITAFSQTDYPFSHHAKMFGLRAAIAIPLRTASTGSADFVLELFLPTGCEDTEAQKRIWNSLPISIQQACQSLQVVLDKEDVNTQMVDSLNGRLNKEEAREFISASSKELSSRESSSWITQMMEAQQKGKGVQVSWNSPNEKPEGDFKVTTHWDNNQEELYHKGVFPEFGQLKQNSGARGNAESSKDSSFPGHHLSGSRKSGEKRRTKTEKTISLEVLRQYFAGSLKDAAKSIGVCPTTLKRICRQHGITRWPSRKLKKVGHSLKKLQLVIDSVQGAEGALQIGSFYTAFPELTSPKFSGNGPLLSFQSNDDSKQVNHQPESGTVGTVPATSKSLSSSSSQSSGSSISCSTGVKQQTTINNHINNADALMVDDPGSILKRTHSDAELHVLNREEPKLLVRSQSHKTFDDQILEARPPLPKCSSQRLQNDGSFKVKATFGEDKIRFCLQPNWGFGDLQEEIAKRFSIEDMSTIDLKYLDDDKEWVLLTCDADLDECKEVYRSSQVHTIKMSLHRSSHPHLGSSYKSGRPV